MNSKTVDELGAEELDFLRFNLYYGDENYKNKYYKDIDDITNEILFESYAGISFVPEDFNEEEW